MGAHCSVPMSSRSKRRGIDTLSRGGVVSHGELRTTQEQRKVPHRLPMRSAARLFCLFCLVFAAVAPLSRQPAEAATPEELAAAFTSNCFDAGYSYSATACEGWLATLPQSDAACVLDNLIAPPLDSQDELGGAGWPNPDASRWTIGPPKSQLDTRQPAHFIRVERSPGATGTTTTAA